MYSYNENCINSMPDFVGERCQTSFDDCAAVSCPGGGICVDGVSQYFCECPAGMVGPDCNKGTYTFSTFDLRHPYRRISSLQSMQPTIKKEILKQCWLGLKNNNEVHVHVIH